LNIYGLAWGPSCAYLEEDVAAAIFQQLDLCCNRALLNSRVAVSRKKLLKGKDHFISSFADHH